MWGFIALIIIVAIAFGITLHEAFWGIIAFCVGMAIFLIVSALFGYGIFKGAALIKKYNTPQAKAVRKVKRKQALKNNLSDAGILFGLFLWFLLPASTIFLFVALSDLIKTYFGIRWLADLMFTLAFIVPFFVLFGSIALFARFHEKRQSKKHANK